MSHQKLNLTLSVILFASPTRTIPRLLNAGTTQKEIAEAVRQCRREKHFRAVSCNNKGYDPMNESIEKVASGLKKMFSFKKTEYEKALAIQTPLDMGRPKHAVTA